MARVNVYDYESRQRVGHFAPESAELFGEATRWDGENQVSVNSVGRYGHQALYRTAGGRWVLNTWSQWQGVEEKYEFVSPDAAREWLVLNEEDEAVERLFGALGEEEGPNLGGRPKVGDKIDVRLDDELLARVDAARVEAGVSSRAGMIRALVATALDVPEFLAALREHLDVPMNLEHEDREERRDLTETRTSSAIGLLDALLADSSLAAGAAAARKRTADLPATYPTPGASA